MTETLHDRLEPFDYQLIRKLRDVPPHEVYEITIDGRRAVYKGNTGPTGRAQREGAVLSFVGARTTVPVPDILHVGPDFYVAAWHPDAPEPTADGAPTGDWSRAAGYGLATLHADSEPHVSGFGRPEVTSETMRGPHEDWHTAAMAYLRERRTVLAEFGHADVAAAVLELFEAHPDAFAGAGGSVCCHGWWTPEHVAVRDGAVACVVDFEHALAAPGEYDYWRTVLPTYLAAGLDPTPFREAYTSVRPFPAGFDRRAPFFQLLCGVYYLESLYVQAQHDEETTASMAETMRERVFDRILSLE